MQFFRKYPYELHRMSENDWAYVERYNSHLYPIDDFALEEGLRYPGFIKDEDQHVDPYIKFFNENLRDTPTVKPRGNLGTNYLFKDRHVILCGIAPGFSKVSRDEPKWLLGPSSKLLHKILYFIGVYPYFTNIYKSSFEGNNSNSATPEELANSLKLLGKEFESLYETFKKPDKIYVITLGSYKEYRRILEYVDTSLWIKFKIVKTYHPSYYLRNHVTSIDNLMIQKAIRRLIEGLNEE